MAPVGPRIPHTAYSAAKFAVKGFTEALTSAAQAATIILDGVKANWWRIPVGVDAHKIDEIVRQSPERAYDRSLYR